MKTRGIGLKKALNWKQISSSIAIIALGFSPIIYFDKYNGPEHDADKRECRWKTNHDAEKGMKANTADK